MLFRCVFAVAVLVMQAAGAWAQGAMDDILAGKLVDPKVGQWAWYDITDGERKYVLRQAIVGQERVGSKTGYWVEFELIPSIGFGTVYKMLLTGPASDPDNIKKLIVRQGNSVPQEVSVEKEAGAARPAEPRQSRVGEEEVQTLGGPVRADHVQLDKGGEKSDVWMSDKVPPCGIVQMKSASGTMVLRNFGMGGQYANSVMDTPGVTAPSASSSGRTLGKTKVEVKP